MLKFEKRVLKNGLRVIVHEDNSTPLMAVNVLYDVGARDESIDKTGFAHLFEHLMFGGSVNIPNYDEPLQNSGGENNAFTNNDITNYYLTLPAANIETGLWLESDRMLNLAFSEKSLDVQRSVVIEEFKQRYLNQPFGDVWLLLRPLLYKVHPYQWPTIGKDIKHIEDACLEDVKDFFHKFYHPGNAILVLAGNLKSDVCFELAEKWFGNIPGKEKKVRDLPVEKPQTEKHILEVYRDVPMDAIYMVFHAPKRMSAKFYHADLLSDLLSRGRSSRLFNALVKGKKMFSEINAYTMDQQDGSLFVVEGKLAGTTSMEDAENAIWEELNKLIDVEIGDQELTKVKNKWESTYQFSQMNVLNKAMGLAFGEVLGDADLVNKEPVFYNEINADQLKQMAEELFRSENCTILKYHKQKKNK